MQNIKQLFTNNLLRHAEFISASQEIPKQVRNDMFHINDLKKLFAFTLAETLIVIGIIGVVAALTIPNLSQNTGEKEKVTKLKKVYSELQDAYGRAIATYGPFDEWFINDSNINAYSKRIGERMTEFLKVSKNCGMEKNKGCMPTNYHLRNSTTNSNMDNSDVNKVILANGTSISFSINAISNLGDIQADSCANNATIGVDPYCAVWGIILVDIDGQKGANTSGIDTFRFYIDINAGILPSGGQMSSDTFSDLFDLSSTAAAWVIETGNMDYLKADSTGKCPNGTVLSWTNTTCK